MLEGDDRPLTGWRAMRWRDCQFRCKLAGCRTGRGERL